MCRLDHIRLAIPAGTEDACRAFRAGIPDFDEIEKPEMPKPRGGAWFMRDGVVMHLGVEAPFSPAQKAHPAFAVTGLDDLADALARAGHPIRRGKAVGGRRRFFTDDPVGNRLEFMDAAT